jgi:3-deoxy-D-manno-octulosonic-acid transferase
MFGFFYSLFASVSLVLLNIIGLFSNRIKELLTSRKSALKPQPSPKTFWIHCASLGEYEMALPLVEKILEMHKLNELLITFFSPSGYKQAIKGPYSEVISYLPFDTKKNAAQFYQDYSPKIALFIRYDFWYNFIRIGLKRNVQFYVINGRFSTNHFILKWIGLPYKKLLNRFRAIFLSDKASMDVLMQNGFQNVLFTGDTRYDRVAAIAKNGTALGAIAQFKGNRTLLVVGSSWEAEEQLVLELAKQNIEEFAILIAPHDIKRSDEIAIKFREFKALKYSEWDTKTLANILIIDNIGMLSRIYRYADFALIGGGFSGKLHNILEPSVWGCPVFFGPNIGKFPEAADFINAGFGFKISDSESFFSIINHLLTNAPELAEVKAKSKQFTKEQIGASGLIYDQIIS